MKIELTPTQVKFVEHYAEHSNATQAYLFAYPDVTYDTARTEGSRLLKNPLIEDAINERVESFKMKVNISKEKLIAELTATAEEARAKKDYKAYGQMKNMIIKMFGFYEPEKVEHTGAAAITIIKTKEVKKDQ